jgi:hypothetical protein
VTARSRDSASDGEGPVPVAGVLSQQRALLFALVAGALLPFALAPFHRSLP